MRILLHQVPAHVAERLVIADPPEPRGDTAIKPIFAVSDLVRTQAVLTELGGQFFDTVTDDAVDSVDPEGNVFRLEAVT